MNHYPGSALTADEVFEFAAPRVVVATGATWRRDGVGRFNFEAVPGTNSSHVLTPDDLFDGAQLEDPVVIHDEDGAYLGSVIAEKLHAQGQQQRVALARALAPEPKTDLFWQQFQLIQQDKLTCTAGADLVSAL